MIEKLTHFDAHGRAVMVDVTAQAGDEPHGHRQGPHPRESPIRMTSHHARAAAAKGDVLGVARVAGIMAVKRTSDLIPMCHPLMIGKTLGGLQRSGQETSARSSAYAPPR